jgi:uncharacterized protein
MNAGVGKTIRRAWVLLLLLALFFVTAFASEVIPPVPAHYFNDYAGVISAPTVQELNSRLEAFEKATSSQIVVAIYPKMESDSSIDDYTVRVAQAWGVGQKEKRNGAVLFLFIADRKMFLQVGYGLEGAIPDALAKQITEFEIKPRLQRGDYDGALRAGVTAILQAAQGEYKGTGRTVNQQKGSGHGFWFIFGLILFILIISRASRRGRGRVYGGGGWGTGGWGGGSWGGGGGGSWSSGSSSGGFSPGGGSFGGGGAGSSW